MLNWKFCLSVTMVLSVFLPLNANAKAVQSELVRKLISEAQELGLKIDESKIVTYKKGDDGEYAAVPLISGDKLDVSRKQVDNGEVYVAFQCMKTKKSSGCYKIQLTDFAPKTKTLKTALVDGTGKTITKSELSSSGQNKITPLGMIVIQGPVRVFINGCLYRNL